MCNPFFMIVEANSKGYSLKYSKVLDLNFLSDEVAEKTAQQWETYVGSADAHWESWSCQVEIRSVNQRFLDIRFRLPLGFQTLETDFKKQIKAACTRGKVDCSIRLEKGEGEEKLRLNHERAIIFNELLEEFEELSGFFTSFRDPKTNKVRTYTADYPKEYSLLLNELNRENNDCLLYTSPSPRD